MARLREQLGLPETATPHALRHSFATHLLGAGADPTRYPGAARAFKLSTTQRYTASEPEHILAVFEKAHPRAKSAPALDHPANAAPGDQV
jgi:integrase/recombinase XerC